MLTTMLTLLVAQALAGATPPPAAPPPGEAPRPGRIQVFIAPSGEPFRVPEGSPYPVADWFAGADRNHDGKLTESEFTIDFLRYFAALDLDHDGVIDSNELERYEAMVPELHTGSFGGGRIEASEGGDGEDGQARARSLGSYMDANSPQGGGRFDLLGIPEPVASMDTTLKGRINREQASDAASYRFSLLDMKHHGYLALEDLPRTYAQKNQGGLFKHGGGRGGRGSRGGMGGRRGGMGGSGMGGAGGMGSSGMGGMGGGDMGGGSGY